LELTDPAHRFQGDHKKEGLINDMLEMKGECLNFIANQQESDEIEADFDYE